MPSGTSRARNRKGLDNYNADRVLAVFRRKGREACVDGLTAEAVLETFWELYPGFHLGETPEKLVGNILSHNRKGSPKATKGTRHLFHQVSRGFWTLQEWEDAAAREAEERTAVEVKRRLALHLRRDRSDMAAAFKRQLTDFRCEACTFDFEERFGPRGNGYIEAHHNVPINEGVRVTTFSDFRAVCSNCHSMLHCGGLTTVEELKRLMAGERLRKRQVAQAA